MIRAALLAALVLAAPMRAVPARAAPHDDLVIGVASFPTTLHPSFDPDVIKFYILGFVDRPVTAFDPQGQLGCLLCTSLPTVENGGAVMEMQPDGSIGMAVTFQFAPGLQWADGAPLGAADLAFTARVGRDKNSGFANTDTWERVRAVDVPDPQTAVLHYSRPTYAYNVIGELLPAHLETKVFDKAAHPGDYLQGSLYNSAPLDPGLYNGPYRITGFDRGTQIVLEPNPRWTGAPAQFRRIVLKTIGNTTALQANLLSGDVDMTPGEGVGLTIDQVLVLQTQFPDRFTYAFKPNLTYQHIDLQLDNPILADRRVRRALMLGMDRQAIADKLLGGRAPVADSFVSPLQDGFVQEGVPVYPFDPVQARALLAEAGWVPGEDGVCRNAAGDRLSLVFATSAGTRARELQQLVLQSDWRKIGVETVIKNEPPRTLFGDTLKHRTFTGMAMFAWSFPVESSPRQILSSGQIPSAANNWGGTNYTGFRNAEMDRDIDALELELDPARRRGIWADIQRIYAEELPALPIVFGAEAHVWPLWLKGVVPTGHNQPSSLHAEDWRAE